MSLASSQLKQLGRYSSTMVPAGYVGLAIYVVLFDFQPIWACILWAGAVISLAAVWVRSLNGIAIAPKPAIWASRVLGDVPPSLLALLLPIYMTWLGGAIALRHPATANYSLAAALWLAGTALFVGLLVPWDKVLAWLRATSFRRLPWVEIGAAFLITAVALTLRLVNVAAEPNPYSGDEANFALEGLRFVRGETVNVFSTHAPFGQPALFGATIRLSFAIFGVGVLSARLVSVLVGVATIPIAYLLLREAFGRSVALAGTGFLAVYHLHVHFSRLSMNNITAAFIAVLALYFTARAVRTKSTLDFGLAGAASALSLYSYVGARLVPLVVGLWLGYAALLSLRDWRRWIVGAGVLVAGFAVVALPQGLLYWQDHNQFLTNQRGVNIFASGWLADEAELRNESQTLVFMDQLHEGFGVLVLNDEHNPHYNSQAPLLGPLAAALFVVGGAYSLTKLNQAQYAGVLALLVATMLLGGALSVPPLSPARLVTAIPAIAAFVGLGIVGVARLVAFLVARLRLAASLGTRLRLIGPLIIAAFVLALAGLNIHFYFADYLPSERFSGGNTDITEAASKYVVQLGDDYVTYWFGAPWIGTSDPTFAFLTRDQTTVNVPEDPVDLPEPQVSKPNAVFLFVTARADELRYVQQACPNGIEREFDDTAEDRVLFTSYEVRQASACVDDVRFPASTAYRAVGP
jgi:4-amino-4-deoxy-L-arabinose transferase-like glycosyltransferase